ncbi:MAG: hypothetical protein FH756_04770 [Firmicutes bacterium]|nr:hypothetical protein [Bacillota bacterium]
MSKPILFLLGIMAILALLIIAIIIANYMFNKNVNKEVGDLFGNEEETGGIVQTNELKGLPQCVQKWLEYSQVIGKENIRTVRLKQEATMRTQKESRWMPTKAEQYFTTDEPGFIWKAKIKAAPLIHIVGRDKYYEGKGNMFIKLLSLITVADAKGKEVDQGTLLRYLAETVWFPTAALSDYITWEEIDANSAKAVMSYGEVTASGIFHFNQNGEVINFVAERYKEKNGQFSLETWTVLLKDYKEVNGIKIPIKGEVIWNLKDGDFKWYRLEIVDIDYNKPFTYS